MQVDYNHYYYLNDPEFIGLVEKHIDQLKEKFDLSKSVVSIISTDIPVVWAKLLSDAGCMVKIIGYNPLLVQCKEIIETIDNVSVHNVNIFVDDIDSLIQEDTFIVFPDFEYYVPLDLVSYDLSNKNIFVVNCFKDNVAVMEINQPNIVSDIESFKSLVACDEVRYCEQTKYKDRDYFYFMSDKDVKDTRVVKFITMKWGTKYGPEYVNRLYQGIKRTYSGKFAFYCVTDDVNGLDSEIRTLTFRDIGYEHSDCFTIQKMFLFRKDALKFSGPYVVLDLDVIVLNDLKPYFDQYNFTEGRFIKNYWEDIEGCLHLTFFGSCWLNSSFVTWNDDQLDHVYQFYQDNKDRIEWKYGDLDWFLWCTILDDLKFHPPKTCYAYSFGAHYPDDMEKYKKRDDYLMTIFNTSHGEGIELHEADGWVAELWS